MRFLVIVANGLMVLMIHRYIWIFIGWRIRAEREIYGDRYGLGFMLLILLLLCYILYAAVSLCRCARVCHLSAEIVTDSCQ